ncbi:MAG: TetR/AcrR family transcriptional regulator [Cumulibacter sp.]
MARKRSLDEGPTVRQAVLDAGARLYSERGFRATSIRDLADAAGISSSTMYHHFANKQQILYAILTDFMRSFAGEIIPILTDASMAPQERITEAVRLHLWISERDRLKLVVGAPVRYELRDEQRQALSALTGEYRGAFHDAIGDGVRCGVFDVANPRLTTIGILDMLNGVREWHDPTGALSFEQIVDHYQQTVLRQLGYDALEQRPERQRAASRMHA